MTVSSTTQMFNTKKTFTIDAKYEDGATFHQGFFSRNVRDAAASYLREDAKILFDSIVLS